MRLWKTRDQREWERFLTLAEEDDLVEARNHWKEEKLKAINKMRDIQKEVDRRAAQNPPERGQEVRINA